MVDIVVQYRHQAACGLLGVPLHLEVLDVGVGRHPKLVLGGLGQIAPQHCVDVLEDRFQDPYHDSDTGEDVELVVDVGVAELS